jgi:Nuclease-related domain
MADREGSACRGQRKRTTFVDERTWAAFAEFKAGITGRKGESAVARELARLGRPALHDAILVDANGVTQIDHVVRDVDAIIVIETKTYAGDIIGMPEDREWMQHLADGEIRHSFQNPIRQNHRHCRAVENVLAGLNVPIAGYVVSAGSAHFSDNLQTLVVPIDRIAELFRGQPRRLTDPAQLDRAWGRLVQAVSAGEARREEHQGVLRQRREGPTTEEAGVIGARSR